MKYELKETDEIRMTYEMDNLEEVKSINCLRNEMNKINYLIKERYDIENIKNKIFNDNKEIDLKSALNFILMIQGIICHNYLAFEDKNKNINISFKKVTDIQNIMDVMFELIFKTLNDEITSLKNKLKENVNKI